MPVTDRMPTAARLVAAILLAALAWVGSEMFRPLMPPATDFGWFNEVNLGLGVLCGWFVLGSRAGNGYADAAGAGLTGLGALVFWALFLQSFNRMLKHALEKRYDGPVEALIAIFEIGVDFAAYLLNGPLIAVLVGGAVVIGVVTEFAARRWS
ncbi:TrgA family protein [Roseovarius sp. SYSU LYC5161]|uniref:TrgA family protein n=1 Tax=Roseovarius halophilus (ex Wu et al. 2025) TaxID=3376060 RepID=UPI002870C1D4|nr:TrgA family protein [Roseovarius sp.]